MLILAFTKKCHHGVNKTVVTLKIAFFQRPEIGRWPSDIRSAHPSNRWDFCFPRCRLHSCTTTNIGWSGRFWSALGLYFLLALNILVSRKTF